MTFFRDTQESSLLALSQNANSAISTLRNQVAKVESIMKIAELAREKETEREQIMPFELLPLGANVDGVTAANTDENQREKEGLKP